MKPQIVRETVLAYHDDKSDKIYKVFLLKIVDDLYQVGISYGKKNSKLRETTKTPEAIALAEAETIFYHLVNEKLKKGYREAAYSKPTEKTLEYCQAIIDCLKQESTDNFLARAISAGLNPLGDFTGANVSNLNFTSEEFEEELFDLTNANLQNTNLSGGNLVHIDLSNSNLKNANLNNARLSFYLKLFSPMLISLMLI
ncbi:MAG: pentapeptide repeat-containing protein [Cyanobacteria bacterium P01_A01_bin.68]